MLCANIQSIFFLGILLPYLSPSLVLASEASATEGLPDSIKRVGVVEAFPNEYPGQVYAFNWCLNKDGVTPLRRSAFRISKALDLKVAGLTVPTTMPLKVRRIRFI